MPIEIERKFLVTGDSWRAFPFHRIRQVYLCHDLDRTVRVRIQDDHAYLAIKGGKTGISRVEFEYEIPMDEAQALMELRISGIVSKHRHVGKVAGHIWEVDEFLDENRGLIVAEIELDRPDESFTAPDWLGEEVTHDPRYTNAHLAAHPYATWPK